LVEIIEKATMYDDLCDWADKTYLLFYK
jgi:hypothetical protein